MIAYKYKLYQTNKTKHLDKMLREACFVWNHALALQKRYYRLYNKYINAAKMKAHFAKRIKRNLLYSQTTQEILERLDQSYERFFKRLAARPPKFKKARDFATITYKQKGFKLNGNLVTISPSHKTYKFSYSRPYKGKVKRLTIKRSPLGEYYILILTDAIHDFYRKSHNGASIGIDFGLKTYMTLSDGTTIKNPRFVKASLSSLQKKSRKFSMCKQNSNHREQRRMELNRQYEHVVNRRNDWQWKLAHELCRQYDRIFIEDLRLTGMAKLWGRKMSDLAHAEFVSKLEHIASKYGVLVHRIDRFYASSKSCTCGYVNKKLTLLDRFWTCPICNQTHDRDLLAANNILRKGISELESEHKTTNCHKTA